MKPGQFINLALTQSAVLLVHEYIIKPTFQRFIKVKPMYSETDK